MKNIIDKYKYGVRNIIKNLTGRYDEDIEQEVYIKTWKNLDKYEERNRFKSWLNVVTYNVCRDYLRKNKAEPSQVELSNAESVGVEFSDEKQDNLQRQRRILKEINNLPKKMKEVVIYHELEERTYDEISILLNIPVGTVKSRLHNAKEILREKLEDLLN
ncbi:RNA polymerase sigma factor [bacterium]|nr:RNA polymerase sigma factor [bacterium]